MPKTSASLRAFFGHHKCATGWINFVLSELCFHMGRRFMRVNQEKEFRRYTSLAAYLDDAGTELVAYNNAKARHLQGLPLHRGVHVVRDPRDILVSAYFSHLHSHHTDNWPELLPHRERLAELPMEEGLFAEMEFSDWQFKDMYDWDYDQEKVLEMKMEDVTGAPVESFQVIMDHFGWLRPTLGKAGRLREYVAALINRAAYKASHTIPGGVVPTRAWRLPGLSAESVRRFVEERSFAKLTDGRSKGEENKKSHYRKGKAGDWKNHFSEEHERVFEERHGDLIDKMGYRRSE